MSQSQRFGPGGAGAKTDVSTPNACAMRGQPAAAAAAGGGGTGGASSRAEKAVSTKSRSKAVSCGRRSCAAQSGLRRYAGIARNQALTCQSGGLPVHATASARAGRSDADRQAMPRNAVACTAGPLQQPFARIQLKVQDSIPTRSI